jgi:endonuclease-3
MNSSRCHDLFVRLRSANPNRLTELTYATTFQLLIAVILSAQATDKSVNLATRQLFADAPTPQAILALGESGLAGYINRIGLYQGKARNIIATCRQLLDRHGGEVPPARAWPSKPCRGSAARRPTWSSTPLSAKPTIAVDTHIFRVANRTGLAPGKTPLAVERELLQAVPEEFRQSAHHWLILHGRYVCKARKPDCWRCDIADLCAYPGEECRPAARRRSR